MTGRHHPDHAALVGRYFEEVHNRRDDAALARLVAPDLVEPTRRATERVRAAFPDYRVTLLHVVADADAVAASRVGRGTHRGVWDSPVGPVAPTGRPVAVCGMTAFRLAGGRIVEVVASTWDHLGLLQQLGAVLAVSERPGA